MRLAVLLLSERLEQFRLRELAEDLMRVNEVVAVDPPRAGYHRLATVPDAIGVSMSIKQAKRLRKRLPGEVGAVAIFHPGQYPLARGLLSLFPDAELWYSREPGAPWPEGPDRRTKRLAELDFLAARRAALLFDGSDARPLWERLSEL